MSPPDENHTPFIASATRESAYFEARTLERDGKRVAETVPDQILAGEHGGQPPVYVDLAHYAATVLGQQERPSSTTR